MELDTQNQEEVIDEVVDTEEVEVVEEAPKSMDDTIRETYEKLQAEERARDEKGRFVAQESQQEEVKEEVTPEVTPEPVVPPVVPPEVQRLGLKKEEAEAYAQAPEILKQAFIRRSEEMHKGLDQFRQKAQFGAQMEQVITPYMQHIQAMGATPEVAVSRLLNAEAQLRYGTPEQKQAMFYNLAQDYGVQLNGEMPQVDPNVSVLQQQIQQLTGWIQEKQRTDEQRQQESLNSEIQRFASDPSHKHFEAVRNDMAALLQGGVVQTLQEAYDRAVYANPNTRALMLAEQQAQAEEKRKQELAQKAQEAKKAAAVNVPKKGKLAVKRPIGTMDDTIRETAERLGLI